MLVRPVMKRLFFPWKTNEKNARFARAPHYYKAVTLRLFFSRYAGSVGRNKGITSLGGRLCNPVAKRTVCVSCAACRAGTQTGL